MRLDEKTQTIKFYENLKKYLGVPHARGFFLMHWKQKNQNVKIITNGVVEYVK